MRSSSLPIGAQRQRRNGLPVESRCRTDNRRSTNPRQSKHGFLVAASPHARYRLPPTRQPFLPAALGVGLVFGVCADGVKRDRRDGTKDKRFVMGHERFVLTAPPVF